MTNQGRSFPAESAVAEWCYAQHARQVPAKEPAARATGGRNTAGSGLTECMRFRDLCGAWGLIQSELRFTRASRGTD